MRLCKLGALLGCLLLVSTQELWGQFKGQFLLGPNRIQIEGGAFQMLGDLADVYGVGPIARLSYGKDIGDIGTGSHLILGLTATYGWAKPTDDTFFIAIPEQLSYASYNYDNLKLFQGGLFVQWEVGLGRNGDFMLGLESGYMLYRFDQSTGGDIPNVMPTGEFESASIAVRPTLGFGLHLGDATRVFLSASYMAYYALGTTGIGFTDGGIVSGVSSMAGFGFIF